MLIMVLSPNVIGNNGIILYKKKCKKKKKKNPYLSYLFFFLKCYPKHTYFLIGGGRGVGSDCWKLAFLHYIMKEWMDFEQT